MQPTKKRGFLPVGDTEKGQLLARHALRPPPPCFSRLRLPDYPSPLPPVAALQYYDQTNCDRSQTSDFSTDGSILLHFLLGTYYGPQLPLPPQCYPCIPLPRQTSTL
jgi:hypothetical protein